MLWGEKNAFYGCQSGETKHLKSIMAIQVSKHEAIALYCDSGVLKKADSVETSVRTEKLEINIKRCKETFSRLMLL